MTPGPSPSTPEPPSGSAESGAMTPAAEVSGVETPALAPAGAPDLGVLKLSSPATREYWEVPVLYQDEHLLAVAKPSGLLTSPDRYDPERPNLMRLLHSHIERRVPWAVERQLSYLSNAHRIDFETSGILLLARSKEVLVKLADQFGANRPRKTYFALVEGTPAEDQWEVDVKLAPYPNRPGVMRVDHKFGKKSRTSFRALIRFLGWTWVECTPHTGRTHQIRVHLKWVKLPIVGDSNYGGKALYLSQLKREYRLRKEREERPLMSRVALHAAALEIDHPVTGAPVRITCPVPRDLQVAVKYLGRYALPAGETVPPLDLLPTEAPAAPSI